MTERAGRTWDCVADQPEDAGGPTLDAVVAPDPAEAKQDVGEHRVPGGRRVVVELLLARDQLLAVCGREEEAAALIVGEELDREPGQPVRLLQPAQLACRNVKLVEPVDDV